MRGTSGKGKWRLQPCFLLEQWAVPFTCTERVQPKRKKLKLEELIRIFIYPLFTIPKWSYTSIVYDTENLHIKVHDFNTWTHQLSSKREKFCFNTQNILQPCKCVKDWITQNECFFITHYYYWTEKRKLYTNTEFLPVNPGIIYTIYMSSLIIKILLGQLCSMCVCVCVCVCVCTCVYTYNLDFQNIWSKVQCAVKKIDSQF